MYRRKRRIYRRKRRYGKRRKLRVPRNRFRNSTLIPLKVNYEAPNVQINANTPSTYFSYSFAVSQLGTGSNVVSMLSIYDQFRICGIKIRFFPPYNMALVPSSSATQTFANIPVIYTAIDYDNSSTPSSQTTIDNYTTVRCRYFNRPHSRYFKPRPVSFSAITQVNGQYGNIPLRPNTWIDCAYSNTSHFGLLGSIQYTNSTADPNAIQQVRVVVTYYLQFRYAR